MNRGRGSIVSALKNINCKIYQGERIALIGHNGAGKSSFLRIVSGIYTPTSGVFKSHAFVHPMINKSFMTSSELSGYHAIKAYYLMINRSLRGFKSYCEDVVDFAGLGEYINLPLKTYSQGMEARLLFSILTGMSHDCLAIDEVLGAGDASFYDKAEKRLEKFLESAGTLILASHSEELLRRFCDRALVFQSGSIVFDGSLDAAIEFYTAQA